MQDKTELQALLVPYPSEEMRFYPVSTVVNNARNKTPDCVKPIPEQGTLFSEE